MKTSLRCFLATVLLTTVSARADKLVIIAGGGTETNRAPATQFQLREPFGVEFDRAGFMFIVEMQAGQRVLKVDPQGIASVIAGNGQKGDAGDGGPAAQATFNGLHNLAVTPNGDVFLADTFNGRIRKINLASGLVTTGAGTGEKNVPPDGAEAKSAPLFDPRAVAISAKGEIYILERGGHSLRFVDATGKIRTVAGTGQPGNTGDDGDARQATLRGPKHLCIDRDGSVLIADTDNHVIRRYLPGENKIVRVAGTGKKGSEGAGGPPLQVELNQPHGVTIGPDGKLYIADSLNNRVLRLDK